MSIPSQPPSDRARASKGGTSSSPGPAPLFADTSADVHWAWAESSPNPQPADPFEPPANASTPSFQFEDVGTALSAIWSGPGDAAGLNWRTAQDDGLIRAREAAEAKSRDEQLTAERLKLRQYEADHSQVLQLLRGAQTGLIQIQKEEELARARSRKWRKEAVSAAAVLSEGASVAARDRARHQVVGHQIRGEWETSRPSAQDLKGRQMLVDIVQKCINRRFPGVGLRVLAFGSSLTGLMQASSDVDLVLFDPSRPHGAGTPSHLVRPVPSQFEGYRGLPEWYEVGLIANLLRRSGQFRNVIPIRGANVPIVEMDHIATNVQADLNVNETFGLINSKLIRAYAELRPALTRPLMSFVKHWAKQRQLNDPAGRNGAASFSSYTLCLLVLQYLQMSGDLPNLQSRRLLRALGVETATTFRRQPLRRSRGRNQPVPVELHGFDTTFLDWERLKETAPGSIVEHEGKRSFVGIEDGNEVRLGTHRIDPVSQEDADAQLGAATEGFFAWVATLCQSGDEYVSVVNGHTLCARERIFKEAQQKVQAVESTIEDPSRSEGAASSDASEAAATADERMETPASQATSPNLTASATTQDTDGTIYHAFHENFEIPSGWLDDALVVQDPFIIDRNTCRNARADMVERLRVESLRAIRLLGRKREGDVEASEMEAAVEAATIEGNDDDEEAKVGPLLYHLCRETSSLRLAEQLQKLEIRQQQTSVTLARCQEKITKLGGDDLKNAPKSPKPASTSPKKDAKGLAKLPNKPADTMKNVPLGPKASTSKAAQNAVSTPAPSAASRHRKEPGQQRARGMADGEAPKTQRRRKGGRGKPQPKGGKPVVNGTSTGGGAKT